MCSTRHQIQQCLHFKPCKNKIGCTTGPFCVRRIIYVIFLCKRYLNNGEFFDFYEVELFPNRVLFFPSLTAAVNIASHSPYSISVCKKLPRNFKLKSELSSLLHSLYNHIYINMYFYPCFKTEN